MGADFYNQIATIMKEENILKNEPMKNHTTFRVGGEAAWFLRPQTTEEIGELMKYFQAVDTEYYVIGNGSNLLVGDKGFEGTIVQIFQNMAQITIENNEITVGAGALLGKVAHEAMEHGLTGLEFAAGIPGTAGGAVVMNAGAYGGEMSHIVKEITVVTQKGEILILSNEELEFGYRYSIIKRYPMIVTQVVFRLQEGNRQEISQKMEELKNRRMEKQPLQYPSAGSTFKRPEGHYAGKLIMDAGLRGFQIGGAKISEKHCGFVINTGKATAADIQDLMQEVMERVYATSGVKLEPEVCMIGEF